MLSDYTEVKSRFDNTKKRTEKEFVTILLDHYTEVTSKLLSREEALQEEMEDTLLTTTDEEVIEAHTSMMKKTLENVSKIEGKLTEKKRKKLTTMEEPREKRPRGREPNRAPEGMSKGKGKLHANKPPKRKGNGSNTSSNSMPNTTDTPAGTRPPPPPPPPPSDPYRPGPLLNRPASTFPEGFNPQAFMTEMSTRMMAAMQASFSTMMPPQAQMNIHATHTQPCPPAQQLPPLLPAGAVARSGQPPSLSPPGSQGF